MVGGRKEVRRMERMADREERRKGGGQIRRKRGMKGKDR